MGYIRKERNFYEYVSDNGVVYEIGDNGADFNIIIDAFMDLDEKFDKLAPYNFHLVDYVMGDIEEEGVLEWIDERVERYENHERKVQFYYDGLCECYIGLKEEKHEEIQRMSKDEFILKNR